MYRKVFKRILDLLLAFLALPFWILILVILAPIIYLQDKGTIFYNAPRLGENGKVFKMYKFRSMKINALDIRNDDGSTFNAEDDPRLTKIGKFIRKTSLDETPQLLNIIKGDMSIIGPRPDLPEHKYLYEGNEKRKLEIKPGITGFNQAYYRNTIPWKERIKNDIYYIDHLSWWLDIKIFFKTARSVLKREDVFLNKNSKESNKNTGVET
ncbi:lipopolysaccharide/colanic/teichoic acid biosynthesis glycosyltransferase [Solibacillus kalamii]|uniref:UDP-phosphate galactose phosphotransferase n=1 Tax=Solibacillus kalamii TaxID=1748298 RepID=A0ABX3ZKU9_9BACL|nr:sugar transferase [Solibacillus kalamii]MBM7665250.1 lipopolysaccharide/colanic/teichoic acid biosynthesis glycosyltransferase [Solibacillus kalamii]OUZ40391.1 UDP-phosphate galactose phosphotransferase [Solibacillus kalamii]